MTQGRRHGQQSQASLCQVSSWDSEDWRSVGNVAEGLLEGDLQSLDDSTALNELARTTITANLTQVTSIATAGIAIIEGLQDGASEDDWQRIAQFAVGIAADKLRTLPDIPAIRLLGKVPGLNLDQITALFARAVDLIGDPARWSRDEWLDIGQAALGMTGDVIRTISLDGLERLGQLTGLDLDKARAVVDRATELLGQPSQWSVDNWKALGRAAIAIGQDIIQQLPDSTLGVIAQRLDLNNTQLRAIVTRVVELRGNPSSWTSSDLSLLGQAAKAMSPDFLKGLGTDAFSVVTTVLDFDPAQLQALRDRAEQLYGQLDSWEATTWTELKDLGVQFALDAASDLTAGQLRQLGVAVPAFSPSSVQAFRNTVTRVYGQVADLTPEEWQQLGQLVKSLASGDLETVSRTGLRYLKESLPQYNATSCPKNPPACNSKVSIPVLELDFCPDQLRAIGGRLLMLFGETSAWNASTWAEVGDLVRGLSPADFGQLTLDGLDHVSKVTCMPVDRMECVVKRAAVLLGDGAVVGRRRSVVDSIAQWSGADVKRLDQVVAGLNPVMLTNLSLAAFEDSLELLSQEYRWNRGQLNVLGDKAVAVFEAPESWSGEVVAKLGVILAGLKDEVIAKIPPGSLAAADELAGQALCEQQRLHVMTPEQLGQVARKFACADQESLFTIAQSRSVEAGRSDPADDRLSSGAIAGIVIGCLLLAAILAFVVFGRNGLMSKMNKPHEPSLAQHSHVMQVAAYHAAPVLISKLMAETSAADVPPKPVTAFTPTRPAPVRPGPTPRPRPTPAPRPPKSQVDSNYTWRTEYDASSGSYYYFNEGTGATQWEKPPGWDQYVNQYGVPALNSLEV
eukprot:TRINITY_DN12406_c0_g1_i4.p1 TRINITY_DN12406_c0_g1~~TRINITY_DN12406_c0_g1_i4.p1  ORF type:complete len:851 (+),score=237.51 TRINITY_DN12406_c0_g1_i4:107-2659(+)